MAIHEIIYQRDNMFKITLSFICSFLSVNVIAHGISAEDKIRMLNASYADYIELGAIHMVTGYDHLLFLLGVVFFLNRFNDVLKFVTAFTIGHSITLLFATLYGIKANYYLIDAVIALTVCYKAFDNLDGFKKYFNIPSPNIMFMVFIFGLIHGFGLSTRLQELAIGEYKLVEKVLSFNIGVEIGQIVALSIMLLLLAGWRKTASFARFSQLSNYALMAAGIGLVMLQLYLYQHDKHEVHDDHHEHASSSLRPHYLVTVS